MHYVYKALSYPCFSMKRDFIAVQTGDILEFCAVSGILQLSQVLFVCCKKKCGRHGKLNSKYVYSIYPMRQALLDRLLWLVCIVYKGISKMLFSTTKGKKRFSCSKNWWKQMMERRGTTRNSTEKERRQRGCEEMEVTLRWNWTFSFASRGCGCFVGGLGPLYNVALSHRFDVSM
jgi:hypothetical protein